ncbi:MAG: hypothetical protein U0556_12675 [Dehalococcoidia bacterium]
MRRAIAVLGAAVLTGGCGFPQPPFAPAPTAQVYDLPEPIYVPGAPNRPPGGATGFVPSAPIGGASPGPTPSPLSGFVPAIGGVIPFDAEIACARAVPASEPWTTVQMTFGYRIDIPSGWMLTPGDGRLDIRDLPVLCPRSLAGFHLELSTSTRERPIPLFLAADRVFRQDFSLDGHDAVEERFQPADEPGPVVVVTIERDGAFISLSGRYFTDGYAPLFERVIASIRLD